MTIEDIKLLIAPDESKHLELKKSTGELKDGMHSACAFLNTDALLTLAKLTVYLHLIGKCVEV